MKNINTTLKQVDFLYENKHLKLAGNDDAISNLKYITSHVENAGYSNIMEAIFAAQMEDNPYFQSILGLCCFAGFGCCKEAHDEALWWREKAAEQDDDCAMCFLERCFLYGDGTEKDYMKAKVWLESSAKKGHTVAQVMLGNMFFDGVGHTRLLRCDKRNITTKKLIEK